MSTESDPNQNQNATPAKPEGEPQKNQDAAAKEAAAKAIGQAKEKMAAGVEAFKKLDLQAQIYLGGLALTVLCSFIFSFWSVSVKAEGPMADVMKKSASSSSVTVFEAGWNGKLAVLAAIAGIGLWVWNFTAKKKEPWAPLAIAGSAGLCALLFILLWLRIPSAPDMSGLGVKVSAGTTLLGFWLPLASAAASAFVSIKPIVKPQPAAPAA
jgi:hypothetical protein